MENRSVSIPVDELAQIKKDLQLIKRAVLPEQELTDWAKKQLVIARKTPKSEYISLDEVENMIRSKK